MGWRTLGVMLCSMLPYASADVMISSRESLPRLLRSQVASDNRQTAQTEQNHRILPPLDHHFEDPFEENALPYTPPPTVSPSSSPTANPSVSPTASPVIKNALQLIDSQSPTTFPSAAPTLAPIEDVVTPKAIQEPPEKISVPSSDGNDLNIAPIAGMAIGGAVLILAGALMARFRRNKGDDDDDSLMKPSVMELPHPEDDDNAYLQDDDRTITPEQHDFLVDQGDDEPESFVPDFDGEDDDYY
eukprot:CAMPEP_0168740044 /NCGR_PEP_ID=MMETSP0724-20121128/11773_1 /TAXON_ID=265536 /ORGANISM="Amphiprora sp., Strain CCMP467" /LENGTH=243 /DNA_ID=CAMNT_0008787461 /DNA_START=487 /DNA_END=1218 /DNA_ORIENTATION=+